jgi:RNA polymerase sigma-70 factor, ECF subfamily
MNAQKRGQIHTGCAILTVVPSETRDRVRGLTATSKPGSIVLVTGEDLTTLLRAWQRGDQAAFERIVPVIHNELRRLSKLHLRGERSGHTFTPTDLISEAYLRLVEGAQLEFKDRAHFCAIASRCMRQILVDHARKRCAKKRGAGERAAEFDETRVAINRPADLVALHEALDELAVFDERRARIIELYYFGGLTQEEIAAVCDVHVNTIARDLRLATAWLRGQLRAEA